MHNSFMQDKIEVTTKYFRKPSKKLYENRPKLLIPCEYYKNIYIINEICVEGI